MLAPLLTAVYFVLTLAIANGNESRLLSDLAWPLAISLTVAAVAWLLALALTRDRSKASIVATLVTMGFGVFGYLVQELAVRWEVDPKVVAPRVFLVLVSALLITAIQVRRSRRQFDEAARFALMMTGLLTTYAAGRLAIQTIRWDEPPIAAVEAAAPPVAFARRPPDIYLIILDKYVGSRQLAATYGFDNAPFEETLVQHGFRVPKSARANYIHTFLSLASMLNLRYLDELPARLGPEEASREPVDPMVEQNQFMRTLKARGYRIVFFPTSYPSTRRNRLADVQIPAPGRVQPEFLSGWLRTTPIPVIGASICPLIGCVINPIRYAPESADFIDWKISRLERLAGDEQPFFAFLHLMLPHEPFIYDADCRHRTPYWPVGDAGAEFERVKRAYTDQIRCLNRKLIHLVSVLQERSATPPVILLQADHGHGRMGRYIPPFDIASLDQRAERASIFAAYALPGAPAQMLSDSVTPINVMRFVLREYLGEALPPLQDATYWSSAGRPYDFVRMTGSGFLVETARPRGDE